MSSGKTRKMIKRDTASLVRGPASVVVEVEAAESKKRRIDVAPMDWEILRYKAGPTTDAVNADALVVTT